jgi:hypothetical protein
MTRRTLPFAICDGGPHLLLPVELVDAWEGVNPPSNGREVKAISLFGDGRPATDYDVACSVEGDVGLIPVGSGHGLIIGSAPPMTYWVGAEGALGGDLVVPLYWGDLGDENIRRGSREAPADAFQNTGLRLCVGTAGLELFSACDSPPSWVYGHAHIQVVVANYGVLVAEHHLEEDLAFRLIRLTIQQATPGAKKKNRKGNVR